MNDSDSFYPDGSGDSTITSGVSETTTADERDGLVVIGYMRQHLLMTQTEARYAKERLAYFARVEGFTLGTLYVEQIETWPAAFEALVADAMQDSVSAVLLPSMLHFSVLGPPPMIKRHFERLTKTRVLAVPEVVSYRAGVTAS
ncbi:hypothetical protein F1D05_19435 [Kribbella qitaiheensis]|uniref:Recombinase family protein n=1 Tax=Kribbella qitaiheensis TaxID=1544730 RepID=A0A7G6X0D2_9ACTN|nr:hypothetical protein [Kribbella qitaiheensis]QNE19697.1 hypothetical protein F1D05_19435 [Kribbella qitaiheensis]